MDSPARTLPPFPDTVGEVLVDWFADAARDLPWRRPGTDPWAVLVSEVMLQQTPVARVEPVWRQWMGRWPTPAALAAASPAEVIRAWGKLGYPRRALRLRETAVALTERHGGVVPADVAALEALPGIGTYTARAVACFGHGQPQPVVDTNVRRVVARLVHGRAEAAPARAADLTDVAALAPADPGRAARFSVAVMELGALVCVARTPRCAACPVRTDCAWRLAGSPAPDGPPRRVQKFAGTDRQVRGRLLDVLRSAEGPVAAPQLDEAWADAVQRSRCLDSLLADGLVEQTADGRFTLPTG
ncbi:A/G-specific adenine glycosylase [Geodermatophilus obscurus]|uniref:Adenine DNA glycosylase n=1 Tax=Geodermatophilus obscurus (strain ATCC 25078 / DSM 43160 / JCM 3152 / CCUG 61914 / KCC A-0152 / KCTC 9177 / NBRC 13315 / NRRL B-3577 / G-20) TaxID=526225 RepID=D2S7C0_GEOOG|nr:A/G-specific adenine glycosylase [Geodermatophilus obscurus]ADB73420.1 HhH-GPD family protein [Geodermatophilus obscurus DSM 43160]